MRSFHSPGTFRRSVSLCGWFLLGRWSAPGRGLRWVASVARVGFGVGRLVFWMLGVFFWPESPVCEVSCGFLLSVIGDNFWGRCLVSKTRHLVYKQVVLWGVLSGRGWEEACICGASQWWGRAVFSLLSRGCVPPSGSRELDASVWLYAFGGVGVLGRGWLVAVGGNTGNLQVLNLRVVDSGSGLGSASLRLVSGAPPYGALRGRISSPGLPTRKDSSWCCASVGSGAIGKCLLGFT